ncbi:MAG TPA: hypothetical protein PL110_02505 [Candidatus Eremiobacteraeota bacterium]|nr:MAG: hypothetical protein BWY64_01119 [bacterium ADurb.Bin363]HPZ06959.1 hypothetical protein [Candidatus Eremiobacteraeota bacterium]
MKKLLQAMSFPVIAGGAAPLGTGESMLFFGGMGSDLKLKNKTLNYTR